MPKPAGALTKNISAWAIGYLIITAQGPSISTVVTLLAVLAAIGLIILTPRTARSGH